MAKLSNEILSTVFSLQQKLLERLDETTATEFIILEQFGETEETIPELDELQNIRERADSYYSRFYTTLRIIYLSQPIAANVNLELLQRTMEEADAVSEATSASVEEIKRNWDLL